MKRFWDWWGRAADTAQNISTIAWLIGAVGLIGVTVVGWLESMNWFWVIVGLTVAFPSILAAINLIERRWGPVRDRIAVSQLKTKADAITDAALKLPPSTDPKMSALFDAAKAFGVSYTAALSDGETSLFVRRGPSKKKK